MDLPAWPSGRSQGPPFCKGTLSNPCTYSEYSTLLVPSGRSRKDRPLQLLQQRRSAGRAFVATGATVVVVRAISQEPLAPATFESVSKLCRRAGAHRTATAQLAAAGRRSAAMTRDEPADAMRSRRSARRVRAAGVARRSAAAVGHCRRRGRHRPAGAARPAQARTAACDANPARHGIPRGVVSPAAWGHMLAAAS
jgi:hypothetical protein